MNNTATAGRDPKMSAKKQFNSMAHYVCRGTCGGVSARPDVCKDEECPKFERPLEECSCEDGYHDGVFYETGGEPEKPKE